RCPESAGDACVLRVVLHPASGADPKHAGLRPKELRNRDQGRNGLSAPWLTACSPDEGRPQQGASSPDERSEIRDSRPEVANPCERGSIVLRCRLALA